MTLAKYPVSGGGSGDISGPGVAVTNNGIVLWDGTGGKSIKDGGVGSANQILKTDGTAPSFGLLVNANVDNSAAIAYSKLALTGSIVDADINASAAIAYSKLALTGSLVNADVNASAAIAYSKLDLTGSIVNADVNASAAIDFSKLATLASGNILVGSAGGVATSVAMSGDITISNAGVTAIGTGVIVNADVSASAAIAYSKLDLGNSIVNSDISSGANIALSKLNSLTSNRAVETNGAGHLSASTVTTTELGYVSGVTSSIQTQLNSKLSAAITSLGGQTGATQTFSSTDSSITITSGSDDHDIELADTIPGARTFSGAVTFSDDLIVDTDTLYVDASANAVGFGTTSPQAKLDVSLSSNFSTTYNSFSGDGLHIQCAGTGGTGNYAGGISFSRISADNDSRAAGIAAIQTGSDADQVGLGFFTHPSATTTDALQLSMLVDHTGNVGIGTTSPALKLAVKASGSMSQLAFGRDTSSVGHGVIGANATNALELYTGGTSTDAAIAAPVLLSVSHAGAVTLGPSGSGQVKIADTTSRAGESTSRIRRGANTFSLAASQSKEIMTSGINIGGMILLQVGNSSTATTAIFLCGLSGPNLVFQTSAIFVTGTPTGNQIQYGAGTHNGYLELTASSSLSSTWTVRSITFDLD